MPDDQLHKRIAMLEAENYALRARIRELTASRDAAIASVPESWGLTTKELLIYAVLSSGRRTHIDHILTETNCSSYESFRTLLYRLRRKLPPTLTITCRRGRYGNGTYQLKESPNASD